MTLPLRTDKFSPVRAVLELQEGEQFYALRLGGSLCRNA
jgi:hypothetical protein